MRNLLRNVKGGWGLLGAIILITLPFGSLLLIAYVLWCRYKFNQEAARALQHPQHPAQPEDDAGHG